VHGRDREMGERASARRPYAARRVDGEGLEAGQPGSALLINSTSESFSSTLGSIRCSRPATRLDVQITTAPNERLILLFEPIVAFPQLGGTQVGLSPLCLGRCRH
jgi:hypothetical protein